MFQDPIVWLLLFLFSVPLKSLDKEINELTAEIEVRKILTGRYVTSLFKVDSLTRIHTIFFELFFFWQVLEEDVEKINNECIKEDEDAFRTSIEVSLVSSCNLTHIICFK